MGLKVKGGMWCPACQKRVAGQKSTNKIAKLAGAAISGGAYAPTPSAYHCPNCGYRVHRQSRAPGAGIIENLSDGALLTIAVVLVVIVAAVILAVVNAFRGPRVVPDVRNRTLASAKASLESAGLRYSYDENQGTFGILDEDNWYVCGETPHPGTKTKGTVALVVRHYGC